MPYFASGLFRSALVPACERRKATDPIFPPDVRNVGVTGSVRLEVLAVREIELPGVAIVGEHGPFVVALARLVQRDAADVALHGLDAGHCDRRSFGDRILRGGEIRHLRERFAPVQGVLRLAERRAGVLQHGGDGGGFLALEFLEAPFDVSLPRLDGGRVVVAGVADVGEAFLDDVAPRERAGLGENGLELGEVAEDAGEEEGFERDPLARATLRAGRGERVEGVEGGVDHAAPLGRHVGDRPEGGGVFGGGQETAGLVVLHAEGALGVGLLEVDSARCSECRRDGFRPSRSAGRPGNRTSRRGDCRGEAGDVVVHCGESVVPLREHLDEAEAVGEVLRALQEAPAVVHQAVRVGAGAADLLHRLHLGDACGLRVEVRRAGELRQFGLHVAQAERGGPHLGQTEGLELDLRRARLGGAVRVDGGLDGEDAAGGEGLAGVVVAHQHRLLHRGGDLRLAAEHVDDRFLEQVARAVVHGVFFERAHELVDFVRSRLGDGEDLASAERLLDLRVDDGLRVVGVHALLRELHEGPEPAVVSVDVESHRYSP